MRAKITPVFLALILLFGSQVHASATRIIEADALISPDHSRSITLPTSALTAGSIIFSDGTFLQQNNTDLFWDNTNFELSIGGHLHTAALGISQSGGSHVGFDLTTTNSNTAMQVTNQGAQIVGDFTNVTSSATQGSAFVLDFARGTISSKTAVQAGDEVGLYLGRSYNGSSFGPGYNGAFGFIATENQTSSHNGGESVIASTPNGALAPVIGLVLNQDQTLQLSHYTTNGFVTFTGTTGLIGVDTNTYVSATGTVTLTNKTISGSSNTLSNIPVATQMQQEIPSGTVNGSNVTFTLTNTPVTTLSLSLYVDGILQLQTTDYTLSSATITFTTAPALGQSIRAVYSNK